MTAPAHRVLTLARGMLDEGEAIAAAFEDEPGRRRTARPEVLDRAGQVDFLAMAGGRVQQ